MILAMSSLKIVFYFKDLSAFTDTKSRNMSDTKFSKKSQTQAGSRYCFPLIWSSHVVSIDAGGTFTIVKGQIIGK